MKRVAGIPFGVLVAAATAGVVGVTYLAGGGAIFSPGELNSSHRSTQARGGVHSHGELSKNCNACHTGLFSDEPMSGRCLACHTEVANQVATGEPLHGKFTNPHNCIACHTEHHGATASITNMASFDHKLTRFPLSGAHIQADCAKCHKNDEFRGTPMNCSACHAEPQVHLGRFGLDCAKCHSTTTWDGAKFDHEFPLTHGGHKKNPLSCTVCHTTPGDYKTYTCYECHEHEKSRMQRKHREQRVKNLDDCAACHANGKEHGRRRDSGQRHSGEDDDAMLSPGQAPSLEVQSLIAAMTGKQQSECPATAPPGCPH